MSELGKAIYDAIENNIIAMVDSGQPYLHWTGEPVDAILDAVIAVLPEKVTPQPKDYDMFGDYDHTIRSYNAALGKVKSLLLEAKSGE